MTKTFKINPKNYNPPFKKHAGMIIDKITKATKQELISMAGGENTDYLMNFLVSGEK